MLGPDKLRRLNGLIAVSPEQLVPRDHFYRHLEATLDLHFVHDWARELYAERGRPSIVSAIFATRPRAALVTRPPLRYSSTGGAS